MRRLRSRSPAVLAAALVALAACRIVRAPPPAPATTPERALEELAPEKFPAFADDLDYSGLDEAIERSLVSFARVAIADPGRTLAFGKERVPAARVVATLRRFRELAQARPTPAALSDALRREFRVFRSTGDGRGEVLFTGYYLPELAGSLTREGPYQFPLHRAPDDLVQVRARDFPALSEDLVGRVENGRLVPYPTRAEIARGALDGRNAELAWVASPVERKTRNSRRSASERAAGVGRACASSRKRRSVATTRAAGTRSLPKASVRPGSAIATRAK